MEPKLSLPARRELAHSVRERYRAADAAAKRKILAEFIAVSGYHPKSAIRILNEDDGGGGHLRRRRRPCLYDEATKQALVVLWEASDRVCGKRLKPLLRILLPSLERHGHLQLDRLLREKLLSMSAATIDRALRIPKLASKPRKPRAVVPEIRRRINVRTFADWHEPPPGSMEMDLVAHCGGVSRGSYVHSLVLTDIASAWTECTPLVVRDKTLLIEALERVRVSLPFPLRALDVDNGGEFVNKDLVEYCIEHGIELTRSRPYRKNDQAWVEQKNGAVVRQMVGYRRLEGIAAAQMLARLYASLRFFVNFFQPSFKLMEKSRVGAVVTKRYHPPQTPAERLLGYATVADPMKARLREVLDALDPLRLLEEIRAVQSNLIVLADGGQPSESKPAEPDLVGFLGSLSSAWRAGEIRPTHFPTGATPKYLRAVEIVVPPPTAPIAPNAALLMPDKTTGKTTSASTGSSPAAGPAECNESLSAVNDGQPRSRNRKRPHAFRTIWPIIRERLEARPNLNASELFDELRTQFPGRYHSGQVNALGSLVRRWRIDAAARGLVVSPLSRRNSARPHNWRTRPDPLEKVWAEMCVSLEADPDQTSLELIEEFQARYPGQYERQLRTLQRRVHRWREEAARRLVFGVADQSFALNPKPSDQSRCGEDGGCRPLPPHAPASPDPYGSLSQGAGASLPPLDPSLGNIVNEASGNRIT